MESKSTPFELSMPALQKAQSFREPQPVVQVIRMSNGYCFPVCPRCRISFEREYIRFCDRCGQRLDWKGFRKAKVIDLADARQRIAL